MVNVLAILGFICLVFSIAGVQLLGGVLRYRCVSYDSGLIIPNALCQSEEGSYIESSSKCPAHHVCLPIVPRPVHGMANFDGPGAALMATAQVMLLEGWAQLAYDVLDAYSLSFVVWFVTLILAGPLFTQLLFKAMLANCLNRLEDNFHNQRLSRALGHWRKQRIARAWHKWSFLVQTRDRYLNRVFAEHAREPLLRGQIRLVMCMWFNIQGYKAWNTWKAAYAKSVARKQAKAAASIGDDAAGAGEEGASLAEHAAQVRSQ
jgi:hypothetical protein